MVDMLWFRGSLDLLLWRLRNFLDDLFMFAIKLCNQAVCGVVRVLLVTLLLFLDCFNRSCDIFQTYNFWRLLVINLPGVRSTVALTPNV